MLAASVSRRRDFPAPLGVFAPHAGASRDGGMRPTSNTRGKSNDHTQFDHDVLGIAEEVIQRADREHPADAVLRERLKAGRFPPEHKRLVSEAVFAYFRWWGWLDARRPVRANIRQAVELARRYAAEPGSFSDADLAARSLPRWIIPELEMSGSFARTLQAQPRLWLRCRAAFTQEVVAALGDCRPFGHGLGEALEYIGKKDLFQTAPFKEGQFELQDIASQLVGLICAPKPGETWWDCCAGEGGKTLHLSDLMRNQGLIWATDTSEWRLERLKRRAARAGVFNCRIARWDGESRLPIGTKFDGVLVDAPCTGVGTWHRNPHARWTTARGDIKELAALQLRLLTNAAAAVKPGGKLVYSVCTLTRAETAGVAGAFARSGFEPLRLVNPAAPEGGTHRHCHISPQDFGGNGMFVCAWRRRLSEPQVPDR